MKLVEQSKLFFREGTSDKAYEIDLCQVGDDAFVVNFRYGRRGSILRDGTKTESPVAESKARAIYEKLVLSKTSKGYRETPREDDEVANTPPQAGERGVAAAEPNPAVVRALLADLAKGKRSKRPIERVVWRVGELALREAEPLLLELLAVRATTRDVIRTYALVWALGRCGSSKAVAPLQELQADRKVRENTQALIREALFRIGDQALRRELSQGYLAEMTAALRSAVESGRGAKIEQILFDLLERGDDTLGAQLVALYRHGSEPAQSGVIAILRKIPLRRGTFNAVRSIFKLAEFRRDARVFGLLGYRFETTKANPSSWDNDDEVFKSPTRRYLRRRVARTLRRLGEDGSSDFVPMAVGVLVPYADSDARAPRRGGYCHDSYGEERSTEVMWGAYASYLAFNTLLFTNSSRYLRETSGRAWRCAPGYHPEGLPAEAGEGTATTITSNEREEAFPGLWDARPEALLHLVEESRCLPVHQMLIKSLQANPSFCASLDIDALSLFLRAPYEQTAQFGFEHIKERPMTAELARLLTSCTLATARTHARQWLQGYSSAPLDDAALWASLITSIYADNRAFVRAGYGLSLCSDALAQTIIARVVAELKGATEEEERFSDVSSILLAAFGRHAKSLGEEVLRDLLAHDLLLVQQAGANLLLESDRLSTAVPEDLLIALIDSEHASIRTIGIQLLGKKPDSELVEYPELFIHLALHELSDLRETSHPIIARLAKRSSVFARALSEALSEALSRALPKGAPANAVGLLKTALRSHLPPAATAQTLRLIKAKSPHARELGALYLASLDAEEFTLFDIVVLANHEMLSIREAAWGMCEASVDRFRLTMPAVARLLDAKWQDTREFGLRFVENRFGPDDLGPAVLIAICDSVRGDVQRFGQELLVRNFQEKDGQEYLAKLSEHPSSKLQLFVTNYLERYASGDAAKLESLSTYILTVLSGVNRGGVAKRRVLRFLASEGLKSEEAAKVVAKILTRQSVTIAIANKASIIESMVALRERYPHVELPITVLETEARHAI